MTLIIPDVKELEQMVPAGGQQPVPVLVPLAVHHRVLVRVNGGQHLDNSNNNSKQIMLPTPILLIRGLLRVTMHVLLLVALFLYIFH